MDALPSIEPRRSFLSFFRQHSPGVPALSLLQSRGKIPLFRGVQSSPSIAVRMSCRFTAGVDIGSILLVSQTVLLLKIQLFLKLRMS